MTATDTGGRWPADPLDDSAEPVSPSVGTARVPGAPAPDQTSLMGVVPPAPDPEPEQAHPQPRPHSHRANERVVKLRAIPAGGGYRSVHSALTRTTPGSAARTGLRGFGEVLITLGAIVLMLVVYQVWGKAAVVASHQEDLDQQLEATWEGSDPTVTDTSGSRELGPPPGHAIARLYIPSLDMHWVVVEGVSLDDIRYAPGRYPTGAMPGGVGNFAVAGHRNPATFWSLDQVQSGELIVVETRETWYVYEVYQNYVVAPTALEVVAPVPGEPDATPVDARLTLTTCHPRWSNNERLIVHATLIDQQPQSAGRPAVLDG